MKDSPSPLMPGWIAKLTGQASDLSHWERLLTRPFDPWCERIVRGESSFWALRSRAFDDAQSAGEVKELAIPLIQRINGALSVMADAEPLAFNAVVRIGERGEFDLIIALTGNSTRTHVGVLGVVIEEGSATNNGTTRSVPEQSLVQRWLEIAEKNDRIADMLVFAGRTDSWFDIYKAVELAESLSGGQHELAKLLGKSWGQCKNMRETANFYRHARTHQPSVLTSLTEAKRLLSVIVNTVLALRVS